MGAVKMTLLRVENIPDELKALRQWVVWRWETVNDKATKPPRSGEAGIVYRLEDLGVVRPREEAVRGRRI